MKRKNGKDILMIDIHLKGMGKPKNHTKLRELIMAGIDELTEGEFEPPLRFPVMDGKERVGEVTVI